MSASDSDSVYPSLVSEAIESTLIGPQEPDESTVQTPTETQTESLSESVLQTEPESQLARSNNLIESESALQPIDGASALALQTPCVSNDNILYEFITGSRSNSELLFTTDENQIYSKRVQHKNVYTYECREPNCGAKVYLNTGTGKCQNKISSNTHNHGTQEKVRQKLELENKIKSECGKLSTLAGTSSSSGNIRSVFNKCLAE